MKALKVLGGLSLLAVLLLLFVAKFSAKESRFACNGKIITNGAEQPATIFLKLQKYRWWVGLWSDSRGSAWVELPNETVSYFGHVTETGDILHFWHTAPEPQNSGGNFSTLSGVIGVKIGTLGVFEGTCKDIQL